MARQHLSTGSPDTPFLRGFLAENGRTGLADHRLLPTAYPSGEAMFSHGSSTCRERWNGGPGDP